MFWKNARLVSTPNTRLADRPVAAGHRPVAIMPTLLRRKMSRLTRTAEKFVATALADGFSLVLIVNSPTSKGPVFPVTRAPATTGTACP